MPNRSTKVAPFFTVYGLLPKQPMDLHLEVNALPKVGELLNDVEDIHEVKENINEENEKYRRKISFEEGEFIMVHLRKGRFPTGSFFKLKNRNFGPCQITKKISDIVNIVDLPYEFNMSSTFIVADLRKYYPPIQSKAKQLRTIAPEEGPPDVGPLFLEGSILSN